MYDEEDFWVDIITVDVCENYWDACISDNPLAKYDDSITYGKSECKKFTDSACGKNRVNEFSVPGSEPEDTTLGAFDLGPYSTVSQVTVPRISMALETSSVVSGSATSTSRIAVGSTTAASQVSSSRVSSTSPTETASRTSDSATSQSPSPSTIAQVTTASKAGRRTEGSNFKTAARVTWLSSLVIFLI